MSTINEEYLSTLNAYGADTGSEMQAGDASRQTAKTVAPRALEMVGDMPEVAGGWGQAVILCAEPGMGRTTLLAREMERRSHEGAHTRYEDFAHMMPEDALELVERLAKWCRAQNMAGNSIAVALDNVPAGDEADAECLVRVLREMLSTGASVIMAILPEGESVVEQFGEASCYWSCNLRTKRPMYATGAMLYDSFVQGVPALTAALYRMANPTIDTVMHDPGYQQVYLGLVAKSLRSTLMGEERRLRLVLLMFGDGTFEEVGEVLGDVEPDAWRLMARDAPLFGVDTSMECFRCAGAATGDGIAPLISTVGDLIQENSGMVSDVVRCLVSRGSYVRAAIVSQTCPSELERCSLAIAWAAEFVNGGQVRVVKDALELAQKHGWNDLEGIVEARHIIVALEGSRCAMGDLASVEPRRSSSAAAFKSCRMLLGDARWEPFSSDSASPSSIVEELSLHGRSLALMIEGRLAVAYAQLLDAPERLRGDTVTSAMLEMDFILCSLLVGIAPTDADLLALDRSYDLLCHANLSMLAGMHETVMSVGTVLAGRRASSSSFEANIHRAERMGDSIVQAVYLVAAAIVDVRARALLRAHVRFGQAMSLLKTAEADYLVGVTHLLDICVRLQLSERVTRTEISSCKRGGRSLDKVVTILLAAISSKRSRRPAGSGRWDAHACPRDVYWILCVLANDFGALSRQIREVLPKAWATTLENGSSEVDDLVERADMLMFSGREELQSNQVRNGTDDDVEKADERRVHINMLGGLEVRADGIPVPSNVLERRRAKSMLALLACLPGHAAKRFAIMESVWPEYDYETAHRCVYSATSVLRSEICGLLDGVRGTDVVASNKSERTVLLKKDMVSCDVDAFEEKARSVLDGIEDARRVVSLCREVEDLYKGDLFVPPTDGAGVMESRARELRELFADVMVAGAQAAMRSSQPMLACRFAKKAHETDLMREDAVRVLLVALCGAGRQVEAEHVYEQYVSHVVDITRRPPSRSLRKVVGSLLLGRGNEGLGRRLGSAGKAHVIELHADEGPEQLSLDLGMDDAAMG